MFFKVWQCSQENTCAGVMKDYTSFFLFFIPGWKTGMRFHPGMKKKEKKTCKHFILGWNFKMTMFLNNFWRMYSNMLSKVNVFDHNEDMNEWSIRPLYKKSEVRKEKEWRQQVKNQNVKTFYSIIFFVEFWKDWNSILL